ncbi:(2Fe-2S)-binding protein [Streptomyces sp. Ru72]|uniref:(2Fe-2S)-binding protein n=1 Tax=Streptomyces sp. Ru72 TaxID=2080747 RepID=UPI000CDCF111|nr:(2Fe-2S)-binding protein [Streptomyces sp. Ru72]POX42187.1 ferric iron reductase [Streptomyces sp. Ru72]
MDLDPDLSALGALGGFFVLHTGAPPRGTLPTLAQAYASGPPEDGTDPLAVRIRKVAHSLRAPELRVAASLAHQGLAARIWSVALGCAVLYGRVPDLDPRLLHWDPEGGVPDDLWLGEVRPLPVDSLDTVVRAAHLAPLTDALGARHGVSARLLWGNAASALAGTVRMVDRWARETGRTDVAERARSLAAGLFAHPGLSGALDPATGRRRSCCLYYRLPAGGLCGDCCFDRPPGHV